MHAGDGDMVPRSLARLKRAGAILLFGAHSGILFVLHEIEGPLRLLMGWIAFMCFAVALMWLLEEARRSARPK